jgi:hypothetical protein
MRDSAYSTPANFWCIQQANPVVYTSAIRRCLLYCLWLHRHIHQMALVLSSTNQAGNITIQLLTAVQQTLPFQGHLDHHRLLQPNCSDLWAAVSLQLTAGYAGFVNGVPPAVVSPLRSGLLHCSTVTSCWIRTATTCSGGVLRRLHHCLCRGRCTITQANQTIVITSNANYSNLCRDMFTHLNFPTVLQAILSFTPVQLRVFVLSLAPPSHSWEMALCTLLSMPAKLK